ncbi:hypothetical protein GQ43DRAFT_365052 [Delitschia confertaspora ATCC 74209]|uniref:Transcription factor domain-containing protein n=1 Tax=Delitschia confertaspora ATCC 74209 TaxID=1513339 RepID=A0A9P4N1W9_9PLEO|nr:hypothetical protein GQ43DRAFT_365052 [Delitschia confertaspora ATCC 74209]
MARTNNLVRHAILALSPTYMLDYMALPEIEERAKFHHGMAVELLTKELNNLEVYDPGSGRETPIVAALILLAHNQIVNWQTWRGTQGASKWYLTATKAEYLLESSDPAYHYRDPNNVQFTKARFALGQLVCLDTVLSDPIFPLDITAGRCRVPWILHGTEHERLRIVGMNGLSPQLMHYFAKITFFAAMIFKETQSAANTFQGVSTFGPTNMGCVTVLMEILEKLKNLRQWSTITIGLSSEEVLCSVHLTEDGKVQDPIDVTQLIAASYVEAAQIYLQCRAISRPREHIEVQRSLLRLLKLIEWQPTSGKLFTAQTPLFAVFIAGIVSSTQYQRAVVKKWFKATTEESRGNVMPVWMALQELWSLQDTTGNFNETVPFMDIEVNYPAGAHAWWEDMVKAVVDSHGRLNLA